MKKFYFSALIISLIIAFVSCTGPEGPVGPEGPAGEDADDLFTPPSGASILLDTGFDSDTVGNTPTGWTRSTSFGGKDVYHVVTNTAYSSYGQSLMIQSNSPYQYDRQIVKAPMSAIPNTSSGKIYIEVNYKTSNSVSAKAVVFYIDQLEKLRIDFQSDSLISAFTSIDQSQVIGSYAGTAWYKVNIILNLSSQTYDVYIDRVLKASNIPCYDATEQKLDTTPISPLSMVYDDFFGVMTNYSGDSVGNECYIDDVLIYYVP